MSRILALTESDESAWLAKWQRGERPSAHPYGIEKLRPHVGALAFAPQVASGRARSKVRAVFEHRAGFPIERALRAGDLARSADCVIGLLEPYAIAPTILRNVPGSGYRRARVSALTCWAGEKVRSGGDDVRARVVREMNRLDDVILLSTNQIELLADAGVDPERLHAVGYGVDTEFYTPDDSVERDIDVLSVGQDLGRDYGTLFAAARSTDARFHVVARQVNLEHLDVPQNVTFHGTIPHTGYRHFLRRARVVAIATRELAYPTGQSVALEAAAAGTPVVLTSTAPMREYFTDGADALLFAPHDAAQLTEVLCRALSDETDSRERAARAREKVLHRYSTEAMWRAIHTIIST